MSILSNVEAAVTSTVDYERDLGIQIQDVSDVPAVGPTNKGTWYRVQDVTAVFADMSRSTSLSTFTQPDTAARAYTYFVKGMSRIAEAFGAKYIDVQGDAIFALYSGPESVFAAFAAATTMRTCCETTFGAAIEA